MLLNYQGSIFAAILGLVLAAYFANRILAINVSDEKVSNLSDAIRKAVSYTHLTLPTIKRV